MENSDKNHISSESLEQIVYRGIPIIRIDFKKMNGDQVVAGITTGTYYIQNTRDTELRILLDTQGMEESGDIQRKFRKAAVEIAHKCRKIAIVSKSQTQKLVGKSINTIVATSVHTFESEQDARDWLAK